jgi:uncharacterized membrane protein HdeD (DUF308 family)
VKPIIGRITATNWVAHLALILAAAATAAALATRPEGELLRTVIMGVLIVLVLMLITQVPVEQRPPGRVSYGYPYAICAAASILMLVGTSMTSEWLVIRVIQVSALLFAIGIIVFAFQVRGLRRSP